jgi:hypothetical protein
MTAEKRVQITSDFKTDTDVFYERVEEKNTGEIKIIQNSKPVVGSSSTRITTNPYTVETDGSSKAETKVGSASSVTINKSGYDTSQL